MSMRLDEPLWPAPNRWPERWSDGNVPRVLIEDDSSAWRWRVAGAVADAGCEVGWCEGPDHSQGRGCPLIEGGTCPLAEGADVIVFGLWSGSRECRALLHELVGLGKVVLAELVDPRAAHEVPEGVTLVPYTPNGSILAHLVTEIGRAALHEKS